MFSQRRLLALIFLCVLLFSAISIVIPVIPISYDEAWNYTNISSKGPLFSITNFPFANNHVFFTFLQSFIVPKQLLWYFPEATRLLNVFVSALFIALLYTIFRQYWKKASFVWFVAAAVICFFVSPLVTPFFIVARGYMLGMVLLLFGIRCLSLRYMIAASVFFILSGWTVVTYIYCLPVIFISMMIISKKDDWKKIFISVFFTGIGLYICYKPILLLVLSQGTAWASNSLSAFFFTTWRSLSYLSFLPYGDIWAGIFSFVYGMSIMGCIRGQLPRTLRYFIVLLTSAIVSYLFVVGVLSLFGIANPPYERAGMFIPLFVCITILIAAFQTKTTWMKILFLCILGCNTLVGLYFFTTAFTHMSTHRYPFNVSYLAPFPYPISDIERKFLKEKKIPTLSVPDSGDDTFYVYFSKIYKVPLVYPKKHDISLLPIPDQSHSLDLFTTILPKSDPSPVLLPTSPLYFLKRIWQNVSVWAITFFSISKKPHVQYLLSLSDMTYKEGELLMAQGQDELAIKTLSRAEHYMTIVAGEAGNLVGLEHQDDFIINEIIPSFLLHKEIMTRIIATADDAQKKALSDIISFSDRNLESVQASVFQ